MENRRGEEDRHPLGYVTGISFSIATQEDIEKSCVVEIESSNEVTDSRLGLPNPSAVCSTCGATKMKYCEGHWGRINLPYTLFHPQFLPEVTNILNNICPGCRSIRKKNRVKVPVDVDQEKDCNHCNGKYPKMKFRVSAAEEYNRTSFVVEICGSVGARKRSIEIPEDYWNFLPTDPQLEVCSANAKRRVLSHAQVHFLIKDLDSKFLEECIPSLKSVILNCVPVCPNSCRVKEFVQGVSNEHRLTYDKRTSCCKRLIGFRGSANELGSRVYETLKTSKLYSGQSSEDNRVMPKQEKTDCPSQNSGLKWLKEVLLAKRSDNCFRMVVHGDPKIKLTEIGVPACIAERMLVPEILNQRNLENLGEPLNMRLFEEGVIFVKREHAIVRIRLTDTLCIGDTIYRPLCDGDTVLVNRPPSIHQHSMIALSVRVLPTSSVLSLNPLCCSPFRGDFDGDCLHGFVPQSIDARIELKELVALDKQLFNGQSGKSLLSLSHDSLAAAYQMLDDICVVDLYNKQQLEMLCLDPPELFPAIVKAPSVGGNAWTGKQVFNMILPRGFDYSFEPSGVRVEDGMLISASSEDSSWLGNNADGNLFHSLAKHYGGEVLETLYRAQDVLCQWSSMVGLSVSLLDLSLAGDPRSRENLTTEVLLGLEEAERACAYEQLLNSAERFVDLPSPSSLSDEAERFCLERQTSATASEASVDAFKRVFRDVSSRAFKYAERDNSLVAMLKSGSKGNVMKLVQQSMCLGAVRSLTPLGFRFPLELSCAGWNDHKSVSSRENYEKYIPFAIVKSSFLAGLNPLESFAHSVTTRDSSFSDNAQLPGTLTRRLMYFMRDISVAYDGTVRNAYGNQLVQLSYDTKADDDVDHAVAGHPVGVLAASALSEAAYSALDQPVSLLGTSPLLNLKNALECGSRKSTGNQIMSLYLSSELRKLRHGLELGALKVKQHLEGVLLEDVTSSFSIIFTPRSTGKNRLSPWVCHFHLYKNSLRKRRLNVQSVIDSMYQRCSSAPKKLKAVLPNMVITSKSCTVSDEEESDTCCITVAVSESATDSAVELRTIQSLVIPYLLGTYVKGFQEIKQVDILWKDRASRSTSKSCGELYLRVTMLGKRRKRSRTCWSMLMDNCLPIMNLIDWSRSHPEDVNEFCASFGITAGWKHFLNNLESAVSDVGKSILPQHLILVANALSAMGEFVGLTAKGFAQQKDHKSPFVQACFSTPANCFIKAAKNEVTDNLEGSIEALSWGNIPRLGTGAQFELLYAGKDQEIDKPIDVFELLRQSTISEEPSSVEQPEAENRLAVNFAQLLYNKYKSSFSEVKNELSNLKEILKKLFTVKDIWNLNYALNKILQECQINSSLNKLDYSTTMIALCFHPTLDSKIAREVKYIKVANHPKYPSSRCFMLVREDGTTEDFSYKKCILAAFQIFNHKEAEKYKSKYS